MNDEQIPDWAKTWYYDKGFAEAEELWRFEERERIIKLLEETIDWSYDVGIMDKESSCQIDVADLIALIKGENE